MRNIILKELTLQNFKGQNRHVVFGDHENIIQGRNASGKSTLIAAWFWLTSSYCNANDAPNSNLFDNRVELSKDTPKASVTALVSIDGETYKLTKTAEAKYTRKRGTDSWEKASSDSYEMFIDDIQRNAGDWKDWLSEHIAPEDMLRFVLSGEFFVNLCFEDKKRARAIIERLVGTVTREEMKCDYSCIEELMKKFSLDEIDLRCSNLIKGIEQRLTEIPSLIHSKENEIAEIEQNDFAAIDRDIAALEDERGTLDKQMTDLTERIRPQMEAKRESERAKQMKEDVFEKAYQEWKKSFDVRRQKLSDEIGSIRRQNERRKLERSEAERKIEDSKNRISFLEQRLKVAREKRETLLKDRDEEKARMFDPSTATCAYCGHQLEGERLQQAIDKFEERKRKSIDQIVSEGKSVAYEIGRYESEIEELKKVVEAPLPEVITQSTEELEKKLAELVSVDTSKTAFMETEQGRTLVDDIGSVSIPEVVMPDNSEIVEKKKQVNDALVPLYEKRGMKSRLTTLRDAVDELRAEQKEKGAEMAQYELQRKAVRDYNQEQMEILSRKVNDGLKCSRISVWSKLKSGETVPDLVLKDENGVNFATSNGANRIRVTADLQRFFCERLGVNMPLWIDESSILQQSNIPHYDGVQTFLLFCSETSLTIESK